MSDATGKMDELLQGFPERLQSLRQGKSRTVFAAEIGESESTLGNYERGTRVPTADFLARLKKKTNVDLDWLLTGLHGDGESTPGLVSQGDFAFLPRYSVNASAGQGLVPVEEHEIERLAFRRDWLREIGLDPRFAGLLTAQGDSMSPTIPDGALMLVDRREDQPIRTGFIYVIALDGDVLVKRVSRNVDGTVDLISDNPLYPTKTIEQTDFDKLYFAGWVYWVGRKL